MSLVDNFKTSCTLLNKVRTSDGEGGFTTSWSDGADFSAAVTYNSTLQARVAEKDGVSSLYTVTTDKSVLLEYHDVFRRNSDNKIFRVTSDGDDVVTPSSASFAFRQVSAEEWKLA